MKRKINSDSNDRIKGKRHKENLKKKVSFDDAEEISDGDSGSEEANEAISNENGGASKIADSKKKKLHHKKDKPPTSQEIIALRETENCYLSSSFRLKIEELLKAVKLKKNADLSSFLNILITFLLQLEADSEAIDLSKEESIDFGGYKLPFQKSKEDDKRRFRFLPPSKIEILGSYPLDVAIKRHVVVDIGVEMPKTFIHKGDNLNYRYHRKRAMYLLRLASELRNFTDLDEMQFAHFNGDYKKPCLLLKPLENRLKKFCVRIIPYCSLKAFELKKFIPIRSNLRSSWYFKSDNKNEEIPTPYYNSSILQDMLLMENYNHMKSSCRNLDNGREAIILLKTWAHQRELDRGFGGFGTFLFAIFLDYLLKNKEINRVMSSYQIIRKAWLSLSDSKWDTEGISLCETSDNNTPSMADFHSAFEIVFVDATGYLNLCANVSRRTYLRVKYEAKLALQFLDHSESTAFDALFMMPAAFVRTFDHIVILDYKALQKISDKLGLLYIDYDGHQNQMAISKVMNFISKGLKDRIQMIDCRLNESLTWDLTDDVEQLKHPSLVIGLLLDPVESGRLVDKGPAADNAAKVLKFREFWGEKSELRHFQDGSTCETVVWPGKSIADKRAVCKHIVTYIFKRHLGLLESDFNYFGIELENVIKVSYQVENGITASAEEQTITIIKSLDDLSKELRKLELDLCIKSVQGISPIFRHSEIFPPSVYPYNVNRSQFDFCDNHIQLKTSLKYSPKWLRPMEVILDMAASNKWPEDLEAIRHLKTAFHIGLGNKLKSDYNLVCSVNRNYIDVVKNGFVFRLIVATSREVVALKSLTSPTGMLKYDDTDESIALQVRIDLLPKLTSALHGLNMQHSAFGTICRLAKRWIYAQLLWDHIDDVAIELLVASLFTQPQPFVHPHCPTVGFLRFLHLLCSFDWKISPLIVNLNNGFTKGEISEIETKFVSSRSEFPSMCILTPFDRQKSICTKQKPLPMIIYRLHCLAKASLEVLENQYLNPDPTFDSKMVFRYNTSLEEYDVVIHLNPAYVPSYMYAIDSRSDPSQGQSETVPDRGFAPVIDFNPVMCYLNELKAMFSDAALFFYDYFGGLAIAVLWKPNAFQYQPFKVGNISGKMVAGDISKKPVMVISNEEAMVEEFANIGRDLVTYITKNSRKCKS
ncbi:Nucleolar protein 6 [Chamberlinius hualienensis]